MAKLSERNKNLTFVPNPQSPDTAGFVKETSDDVVPDGWLEANGQSVLRADYPELFAKIGTTYGLGDDDPNTFNLPGGSLLNNAISSDTITSEASSGSPGQVIAQSGTGFARFGYQDTNSGRLFISGDNDAGDNQLNIGFGTVTAGVPANTVATIHQDGYLQTDDLKFTGGSYVQATLGSVVNVATTTVNTLYFQNHNGSGVGNGTPLSFAATLTEGTWLVSYDVHFFTGSNHLTHKLLDDDVNTFTSPTVITSQYDGWNNGRFQGHGQAIYTVAAGQTRYVTVGMQINATSNIIMEANNTNITGSNNRCASRIIAIRIGS